VPGGFRRFCPGGRGTVQPRGSTRRVVRRTRRNPQPEELAREMPRVGPVSAKASTPGCVASRHDRAFHRMILASPLCERSRIRRAASTSSVFDLGELLAGWRAGASRGASRPRVEQRSPPQTCRPQGIQHLSMKKRRPEFHSTSSRTQIKIGIAPSWRKMDLPACYAAS
jgi:hypothetical protein